MAKVVNTFVKGKLNKDLDARLIPNGEYRDARNVQVSKSEGRDVGDLANVLAILLMILIILYIYLQLIILQKILFLLVQDQIIGFFNIIL